MKNLLAHINKQFTVNSGKNLFYEPQQLQFITGTTNQLDALQQLDAEQENLLLNYLVEKAISTFCEANQYYSFNEIAVSDLKEAYRHLIADLKMPGGKSQEQIKKVAEKHYQRLAVWLKNSNPFAEKVYRPDKPVIEQVVCGEYSAELQLSILQLDIKTLKEPVLDVGCGKKAGLVHHLRENGIEAFGLDRFAPKSNFLIRGDWMNYQFEKESWGSLISNLGFSNHFRHHHLRDDGDYVAYAKKYLEMLQSLLPGGSFYYAPDLPFIEEWLPGESYQLTKTSFDVETYRASRVKKL